MCSFSLRCLLRRGRWPWGANSRSGEAFTRLSGAAARHLGGPDAIGGNDPMTVTKHEPRRGKPTTDLTMEAAIYQGYGSDDDAVFGRAVGRFVRRTEALIARAGPHRLAAALIETASTPRQLRDFIDVIEIANQPSRGRKPRTAPRPKRRRRFRVIIGGLASIPESPA
jgi:hypothetical protein